MAAYQNSGDRVFPLRKPLEPRSLKSMSKQRKPNGVPLKPNGGWCGELLVKRLQPKILKTKSPPNLIQTEPLPNPISSILLSEAAGSLLKSTPGLRQALRWG